MYALVEPDSTTSLIDHLIAIIMVELETGQSQYMKYYGDRRIEVTTDVLVSFLKAVDSFSDTNLAERLTDVGLENGRFHFRRSGQHLFIIVTKPFEVQMEHIHIVLPQIEALLAAIATAHEAIADVMLTTSLTQDEILETFTESLDDIVQRLISAWQSRSLGGEFTGEFALEPAVSSSEDSTLDSGEDEMDLARERPMTAAELKHSQKRALSQMLDEIVSLCLTAAEMNLQLAADEETFF